MVNFLFRIIWIHWRRHQGGWRLTEVSRLKGDKDRNLLFRQKLKRLKIKYWCQNILLNFSSRLTNDSLELHNLIESLYKQHVWHFFQSSAAFCAAYKICHLRPKASDCSPSEAIWLFTANLTTLPSLGCQWRASWSYIRGGKRHSFAFSALVLSGLLDLARNLCWSYFEHLLDTSSRLSYPTNVNICLHAPEIQSTLAQFIATWEWFTLLSCHIKILEGTHKKGWNNKNVNLYTDERLNDKERPSRHG